MADSLNSMDTDKLENFPRRRPLRRQSLGDVILAWGFLLSFAGLFGAACFEAWKIVAVVPHAFEASPTVAFRNPMDHPDEDSQPVQSMGGHMTPQQRAQRMGQSK